MKILQPPDWAKARGYSNGISVAGGRIVFVAGQIGWDAAQHFHSDDIAIQAGQALQNVLTVLAQDGGRPEHIARMTWYVTRREEYIASYAALGKLYRALMGTHYPAMTAVEVSALIEPRAKIEIEATAVLP